MMRVLHIYSGNLYGGIERMLVTLAAERAAAAMEPHFALCFEGRLSRELEMEDVPVHRLGAVRLRQPQSVLRARRRLAKLLRSLKYDVAICHAPWTHALFARTVRRSGVPLVFFQHDRAGTGHWSERLARRVPPDAALCNSHFTAQSLDALFPAVPRDVLYCPVAQPAPTGRRDALRAGMGAAPRTCVIVQVARMEPWKGHASLLAALALLPAHLDWQCWMVGGAQRPEEAAYMASLQTGDDRVVFPGERNDVSAILEAADVFCNPNRDPEPFGVAIVEAMWAGLPVVAFAHGGPAELIDEVLVPSQDVAALAAALARLVADEGLRRQLGSEARERARSIADPARQLPLLESQLRRVIT